MLTMQPSKSMLLSVEGTVVNLTSDTIMIQWVLPDDCESMKLGVATI